MNKIKYCLYGFETFLYFLLVVLSIVLVTIIQFIAFIFCFPALFYDKYLIHKLGNKLAFVFINFVTFYLNRHWKCEVLTDLPKRDRKKRRIFMFNHYTIADPFTTTFLGMRFFTTCLYKDSLHKGYPKFLMGLIGQVPIYFEYDRVRGTKTVKKECVSGVMERCKVLMDNGFDLIVYPEGTRTKTGRLQEFKDGFFRFSMDNNFEIVPCAVHNTKNLLTKHIIIQDTTSYLMVGNPISPKGKTLEDLKFEVRRSVYRLIKKSPKFDPNLETVSELE